MAVEIDPGIAAATQRALGPSACEGTTRLPHHLLARDVWELCSRESEQRGRMLAAIPSGALCIFVAGSPCQQLTTIGAYQGRQG
eukprot:7835340-Prorocentrum_lima.AAC.1